jgi:hypothetical protein
MWSIHLQTPHQSDLYCLLVDSALRLQCYSTLFLYVIFTYYILFIFITSLPTNSKCLFIVFKLFEKNHVCEEVYKSVPGGLLLVTH